LCTACSSSGDSESNRPAGGGSHNNGSGGKGGGTGGSDFGNDNGGNSGSTGTGGASVVVPPVDSSAPAFTRDDTGMSGLPPDQIDMLRNATGQCSLTVMYPYEGTMFAGGLEPPIIMWNSAADAAYAKFTYANSDKVNYEFAAGASNPGQLQIPRDAWNEITRRSPRTDLVVTLNVMSGGTVTSCPLHWRVAPGNMIGAIYYNTYQAPADLGGVPDQGAVMRLSLGSNAEIYKQYDGAINAIPQTGPCYSCHSVSFNGTTLVASFHDYSLKAFHVEKYDVTADVQPPASGMLNNANFGALTPDGTRILAMGNPDCTAGSDTFPRKPNNFPLVEGADVARMLDTKTGEDLHAAGLDPTLYMWMPQFSPNGDKIVYNNAKPDGNGGTSRVELAVMDYDYATNTFSNAHVIVSAPSIPGTATPSQLYSPAPALGGVIACGANGCDGMGGNMCDPTASEIPIVGGIPGIPGDVGELPTGSCTGPCYPAWPFFTPDGKAVIFALTSEPDFANAFPGRDNPALSELWYVDLETHEIVRLDNANKGLQPQDATANYYPTVMPIAVGGYFWVFWTAVRDYGTKVMGRAPSSDGDLPVAALEAIKKRIWVSAIKPKTVPMDEVTATPGPLTDPSLPGFYLAGQSESGNVRAFAALNPCLADGSSCTSGLDCCCGFCRTDDQGANGTCNCEPPMCSKINEKCTTTADCCPVTDPDSPAAMCIGGFCGFLVLD
jgi:hypothetical protein